MGNTMFNYLNHSHTTSQDKWIFYVDYETHSGIYAQKNNSDHSKLLISEADQGTPISVVGNGLYYLRYDKVMRFDLKTEEAMVVIDEPVDFFIVVKDNIYYIPKSEEKKYQNQIYSIKTNGTNKQLLVSDLYYYTSKFIYFQDSIYYINGFKKFVSLSLKNLESQIILDKVSTTSLDFFDGITIFTQDDGLRLFDLKNNTWGETLPNNIRRIVHYDEDTILFSTYEDEKQSFKLDRILEFKISTNTYRESKLDMYNIHYVNVIDGVHYYYSISDSKAKRVIK